MPSAERQTDLRATVGYKPTGLGLYCINSSPRLTSCERGEMLMTLRDCAAVPVEGCGAQIFRKIDIFFLFIGEREVKQWTQGS